MHTAVHMGNSTVALITAMVVIHNYVRVCRCILAQGINFLFPVQTSTYDQIFEGNDVIVQASKHGS